MHKPATTGPEITSEGPASFGTSPQAADKANRWGRIALSCVGGVMLLLVAWAGYAEAPSEAGPAVGPSTAEAVQAGQNGFVEYQDWLARAHERASRDAQAYELPSQF